MYLLRLPNSVYYTRIATPHSLHSRGYPKEIRFSLFTKERRIACLRNVDQTKIILSLFEHANAQDLPFVEFKLSLNEQINQLREQFNQKTQGDISAQIPTLTNCSSPQKHSSEVDTETLEDFIQSKSVESVTALTLKQLRQRCRDFLLFVEKQPASKMTSKLAMAYRDELLSRDLSLKTIKDYIAAIKQFLSWCVVQELLEHNPFSNVKLPSKPASSSSQRPRWGMQELKRLFGSQIFKEQSQSFHWATLVMFYQGCRPSEACQLKVKNIHLDEDIPFIHFDDSGEQQHLKNAASNRCVPIHQALMDKEFLNYVRERQEQRQTQLFDYIPRGDDLDWSKDYRDIMGDILDACGFVAGNRATAYSFRHTFIDELKQAGVAEHVVAQIVGHKTHSLTYGHYGKPLPLKELVNAVNCFCLDPF
ncbi:tyrosine-type recombinase/integrase [Vibrio campbellii]|uniref:tyrosine-type recombinase/integrase n=1 Tax=Vibrio campbellii TaxID=680 RepID=UPI0002FBFC5C|nr:tyrosine-type recombinase/integrase [Vibrio campbellii]AGU98202.1 integrase [Vibrio campbellii ATCC BAA-1116]MBT0124587.1 tyrosine-type recombinase/integrase [Vibrio campbellii]MBT0139455.1 tyrosine-type recombinase/integrase [Vibrio campbellii]MBT0144174.1 tyrosine-type recombinase/integrase [Vibrio campbellii]MBT0148866.1 tyrosine-type recombinase/integrase [Vibrio campbellii]